VTKTGEFMNKLAAIMMFVMIGVFSTCSYAAAYKYGTSEPANIFLLGCGLIGLAELGLKRLAGK
jgi:threonine dehydrogenase-like Zn-dependent dehydrogenase